VDATLLIANADAGSSDDQALADAVTLLRTAGDVEVARTGSPGDLDGALHRRGGRRVVVAGGDGSLHAVVAALHRRNELSAAELGLIPLGTGNDFARGVGVPLDPVEAAQVLLDHKARPVDLLIDCAGDIVVNAVHVGVGAEAGREAENYKGRLGKLGYYVGAMVAGVRMTGLRLRVEADGVVLADLDRSVLQVGIGNGPNVGGGTELVPGAEVDDGLVDVVVSFATGPWERVAYGLRLTRGSHEERPDVSVTRARRVSVTGEDYWCNADGELYGPERNLTWRVEPGALRMVLPPAA
jgi:YegS/Rv2252/BmrU family lipid kinase